MTAIQSKIMDEFRPHGLNSFGFVRAQRENRRHPCRVTARERLRTTRAGRSTLLLEIRSFEYGAGTCFFVLE